jgi:ABC-2 type transport system permease protein/oleandomycin transport system permease protein
MTATTLITPVGAEPRVRWPAVNDVRVITRRNVKRILRTPQLVVSASLQPVLFVLMFRYIFGGVIHPVGMSYSDYLIPGIFVETMLFGATTAVALATDLRSGIIDRFRSLPITRSSVLVGRTLADATRNLIAVAVLVAVGTLVGFRFNNGVAGALAALALVLAIGFVFCWVSATIGLTVKDPETAQISGLLVTIPLIFASSVFVPPSTMPGWLQAFANNQPVSIFVNAVRALTEGGPVYHWLWLSAVWCTGILVVFVPLAVRRYRRI